MTAYEAGDTATLHLAVSPADPTTTATVAVTDPAGTLTAPAATPNTGRDEWTALLLLDQPGEWVIRWTVTGVGAGVETQRLAVAPAPGSAPAGARMYATSAQLAAHLGAAPPPGSRRLLRRASVEVDQLLRTAVYDVDDTGLPTDPAVAQALADAVCAQVEWWGEVGDAAGSGAVAALAGSQIGSVRLGAGASTTSLAIAPGAHRALQLAGLLNHGPRIPGSQLGPR